MKNWVSTDLGEMRGGMNGRIRDAARDLAGQYQPFSRYTEKALGTALRPLETWNLGVKPIGLDLGSGTGVPGLKAKDLLPNARLWAVDCSAEMLKNCEATGCYQRCIHADADDVPVPAGFMDFAMSVHAVHLFQSKMAALVEMARVTKDGGAVLLVTNVPNDLEAQLFHQMMPRFSEHEVHSHFDEADVVRWASVAGLRLAERVRTEYSVVFQDRKAFVDFLASRPFFGLRLLSAQEFAADLEHCERRIRQLKEGPLQSNSALTTFALEKIPA